MIFLNVKLKFNKKRCSFLEKKNPSPFSINLIGKKFHDKTFVNLTDERS